MFIIKRTDNIRNLVLQWYRLLTHANPQAIPFILVGSELGAVNSLLYTLTFPSQASHVFLLDPITSVDHFESEQPEQQSGSWIQYWHDVQVPSLKFLQLSALLGLNRIGILTGLLKPSVVLAADGEESNHANETDLLNLRQRHQLCDSGHLYNSWLEHATLNISARQLEEAINNVVNAGRGQVPCTVITGNYYDELLPSGLNRAWSKSAQSLVTRLKCQHKVINGVDHHSMLKHPSVIMSPLLRTMKQVRQSQSSKTP